MATIARSRFVVLDFETTGFSPNRGDRVIEIGAVEIVGGKIGREFETLVNPGMTIPEASQRVHQISNQMIATAPEPNSAFAKLMDFINGDIIVAHNVSFEMSFLNFECDQLKLKMASTAVCTMKAARKAFPSLANHKLGTLIESVKIIPKGSLHRALPDARCTAELLIHMLERNGDLLADQIRG